MDKQSYYEYLRTYIKHRLSCDVISLAFDPLYELEKYIPIIEDMLNGKQIVSNAFDNYIIDTSTQKVLCLIHAMQIKDTNKIVLTDNEQYPFGAKLAVSTVDDKPFTVPKNYFFLGPDIVIVKDEDKWFAIKDKVNELPIAKSLQDRFINNVNLTSTEDKVIPFTMEKSLETKFDAIIKYNAI